MNQLRWGLIGCGDVARKRVAKAIQDAPKSALVAACRRNKAKLESFCQEYGVSRPFTDATTLINDPDVDAVYIATPVREHLPQTLAAARAGKHVLVEKPMALSVAECDEMIAACQRANVKLSVAYYRRFYPIVERIEQLLASGEIGTPLAVSAVTATPPVLPEQEGYWRVVLEHGGGGALMDIGSHRINIFQYLFGEIIKVKAICETVAADYEAEDTALLLLQFKSGMTGTLQCHFGCVADPDEFSVLGTKGRMMAKPLNGRTLIVQSETDQRSEDHPPAENLCKPLVADFTAAVLEDREPTVSGEEGRAANVVLEKSYRDARSN